MKVLVPKCFVLILLVRGNNSHKKYQKKTDPFPNCSQTASFSIFLTHLEKKNAKNSSHPFPTHQISPSTPTFIFGYLYFPHPSSSIHPTFPPVLHQGPCTFIVFLGWTFRNPSWYIRRQANTSTKETQLLGTRGWTVGPFPTKKHDFQGGIRCTYIYIFVGVVFKSFNSSLKTMGQKKMGYL